MRTRQVPSNLFFQADTFSAAFPLQRVRTLQAAFAVAVIDREKNASDVRETKSLPATLCTRKRIKYPQNRECPRFDVSGYTVPQAAHLFVVELTFRENKLSGERFRFPDSRRPQGLHTRGRHSEITGNTASLGPTEESGLPITFNRETSAASYLDVAYGSTNSPPNTALIFNNSKLEIKNLKETF
jgi:hypothetical protein